MSDRQLIADLLSALEYHTEQTRPIEFSRVAIEAAREYLRKPAQQQEPVAWMVYTQDGQSVYVTDNPTDIQKNQRALPMYTTPPQRTWIGLTKKEVHDLYDSDYAVFHQRIEAKLREKNA